MQTISIYLSDELEEKFRRLYGEEKKLSNWLKEIAVRDLNRAMAENDSKEK